MLKKYTKWLLNAPVLKKFIPMQVAILFVIIFLSIVSFLSVYKVDNLSQKIYSENIYNRDLLNSIVRAMYVCRVTGRDILLLEEGKERDILYKRYIDAFALLDTQMAFYVERISGERQAHFKNLIVSKDIYKESMIASADTLINDNDYELALHYLTRVTPIANSFFADIEFFLAEEQDIMENALEENEKATFHVFITVVLASLLGGGGVLIMANHGIGVVVKNLRGLNESLVAILKTDNMKHTIPSKHLTDDEVGFMAKVINDLKEKLLDYSTRDMLTGGLNANAYHADLNEFLDNESANKNFWIVLFDMNNLKLINDKYGHVEGDRAIRFAYRAIHSIFSKHGKVYRIGGDEFISILRNCTAEDIDNCIHDMESFINSFELAQDQFAIASGYGEFSGSTREEFDAFFASIDKKMYENKDEIKHERSQARVYSQNNVNL